MARGKRYFVRQSFPRGYEGRLKAAFLLRAYPAEEKEMADAHLAALAVQYGCTLMSTDGDFARFAKLKWTNPLK